MPANDLRLRVVKVLSNKNGFLAVLLTLLLSVSAAFAQTGDGTYRLQPDDLIRIQVFNQQQILAEIPVGRDGNVSAPFIGIIQASGKTTSELEAILTAEYIKKLRLKDPIVSVTILRFRIQKVSATGMFNRPQVSEIRPGDTIMTLISNCSGYVLDRSDLKKATLRRANSRELIPIDLYSMLVLGDTSQNYLLQDGDELNLPEEQNNRIIVLGAVQSPGTYQYKDGLTLSDAVSLARGEIRYTSKMSQIVIMRKKPGAPSESIRIVANFVKFIKGQDVSQNIALLPGDFIYVPETNTPDFTRISTLFNSAYIINQIGGSIFGFKIFR